MIWLGVALCLASAHPAAAQDARVETVQEAQTGYDEAQLETAYRRIKRDGDYQFELPDAVKVPERQRSRFGIWLGNLIEAVFSFLAPLMKLLFWIGLGLLAAGALYLIGRAIWETRFAKPGKKAKDAEPDMPLYQPAQAQARILLEEIDALAAQGRYGEAVHTLLFRSIQDIDRNRPNIVRRSLTAREIGRLPVLTDKARTAFSTIAGVSELSHFGGTEIDHAGFETARAAYADLTGVDPQAPRRRRRA